jgi:chromosomal replication initiator protein
VAKDDMEIVSALRAALADKVGQERFALWFGACPRVEYDGAVLRIAAPNPFFLEWIRANFREHIAAACDEVLGRRPPVDIHLDAAAGDGYDSGSQDGNAAPACRLDAEHAANGPQHSSRGRTTMRAAHPIAVEQGPSQPRSKFATLDSFVASEANRLALVSAQTVVRQPGQLSPLIFHGPTSVGKTHLLQGIWSAARNSNPRTTAVYLAAEQFTSYFLEALRGSGLPSFRRKYRSVGLLIIDDLQFFVGKRATQVELLHTVDTFLREGRQLVFAADRSPADLAELAPELTTRLTGGMVCCMELPDHATRMGILAQMAQRTQIQVPPEVQQYIAARLTNHPRELSGALCRLQATSQVSGRPISLTMAEEALADLIRTSGRVIRLPDIEKAVCQTFGLDPASLQSDTKGKRASHPRMLAMWLARKHTRAALSEIGLYFGHRSHSTVVSAQKRVDGWMASGHPVELADRNWHVDDAIRQVERYLVAG